MGGSVEQAPIRRFLFICSACLDICLGKDERIALHWNCATGRGGHCVFGWRVIR